MIVKIQLEKHLPDIINKPVYLNNNVVGKIIIYDTMTGMTDIEITDNNFVDNFEKNSGCNNIGTSSRIF